MACCDTQAGGEGARRPQLGAGHAGGVSGQRQRALAERVAGDGQNERAIGAARIGDGNDPISDRISRGASVLYPRSTSSAGRHG